MRNDAETQSARLADALSSRDPDRVAGALLELRERWQSGEGLPMPSPAPEVLDAFADGAPWEVVRDYIWVLAHYRMFTPPLSAGEVIRRWTEAVVRQADSSAALQVVLYLRRMEPGADVAAVVDYVAQRGVEPGREAKGAEHLARHLLDHSETYAPAVLALASWVGQPVLRDVLPAVAPYVRPTDRARLGLAAEGDDA